MRVFGRQTLGPSELVALLNSLDTATATMVQEALGMSLTSSATIASDAAAATPKTTLLVVDTEGAASEDDLATISGTVAGQRIVLRISNGNREVTVKDGTGNLSLNGDCYLAATADRLELLSDGTTLFEIARSHNAGSVETSVIASGVAEARSGLTLIDTEASAATDDLDTLNGVAANGMVTLAAASSARTVVVKDGTGNMRLEGDCSLDNTEDTITLISDGTTLREVARSNNGA